MDICGSRKSREDEGKQENAKFFFWGRKGFPFAGFSVFPPHLYFLLFLLFGQAQKSGFQSKNENLLRVGLSFFHFLVKSTSPRVRPGH